MHFIDFSSIDGAHLIMHDDLSARTMAHTMISQDSDLFLRAFYRLHLLIMYFMDFSLLIMHFIDFTFIH
jgi:hypothetical protein